MVTQALSLRTKIAASFICVTAIALIITSITNYISGKKLLEQASFNTMNIIRNIKTGQVVQYLNMLKDECLSTSERPMIFDAVRDLQAGFYAIQTTPEELEGYKTSLEKFYIDEYLPKINQTATTPYTLNDFFPLDPRAITLQALYIAQNPHPLLKKYEYSRATTNSSYDSAHEKYHSILKRYAKRAGIVDIYIIDPTGQIVYSLAKEIDLGTNIMTGIFKDTNLGQAAREAQRTTDENFVKMVDFQFYNPSYGVPAGFIGTPIFEQGKKLGVLVFQFPIDTLNDIMTYNRKWADAGLGKTGESFIMGKDKTMRTISREYLEDPTKYLALLRQHGYDAAILDKIQIYDTTVLLKRVDLDVLQEAIEGKTNTRVAQDTLDRPAIITYAPIKGLTDVDWYIVVKISTQEAFEPVNHLLWYILLLGIIIICITIVSAFTITHIFTTPFDRIIRFFKNHVTSTEKLTVEGSSEFVTIAETYNKMVENVGAILKKVGTIQEQFDVANSMAKKQVQTLQQSIEHAKKQGLTLSENNQTALKAGSARAQDTQYHMNTTVQAINILAIAETTTNTITKNLEMMTQDLSAVEQQLSSMGRNAGGGDAQSAGTNLKNTVQHALHIGNTVVPNLIGLQTQYEQMKASLATLQQEHADQNGAFETILARNEQSMHTLEKLKETLNYTDVEIRALDTLHTQYAELSAQLTELIKKADL